MPELQVKKVVAVCFLEGAKLTLEQIGAHRLELSQDGATGPEDLPRLYGDVRRLRDYLQRSVSGYQEVVALDLGDADLGLLVACCRRSVEAIEYRLAGVCPPDERQWLTRKCQVLSDWAVEMAAKPIVELPLQRLAPTVGEASRALKARIQDKVYGDVNQRQKYSLAAISERTGQPSAAQGIPSFADQLAAEDSVATGVSGAQSGRELSSRPQASLVQAPAAQVRTPPLLDCHKVQDPRLRSLVSVDLAAYDRSLQAGDCRLATVLLAGIMESAVIDHAIPRRSELGLAGTPDAWKLHELLLRAMGDRARPKDRSLAFHLFASRNLLRPALQMVTPAVVTVASLERMQDFVMRALHAIGFGAPAELVTPDVLTAGESLEN